MENSSYRIISLEANKIYEQEQSNGVEKGYILPSKGDPAYWHLFKNVLDCSLDALELKKVYEKECRKKFSFEHEGEEYTLAVINVKFNYTYKQKGEEDKIVGIKALRTYFYENGFHLGGVHYVRYKRSSGSSRQGKCLFINEKAFSYMSKWGECGLSASGRDLASWEAYKALSLSSLKGTIDIPLDGILFIDDAKSEFLEEVVSVEQKEGALIATTRTATITNDIWDGESLLDESLFTDKYADKHMLLLRNKFFKSCGFRTKLQQWIRDKKITLDDLKARGFITLATDIRQIVMITTPNSMKFLKFMGNALTEENVRRWVQSVDSTFGVVKYDKRTRFFGGKMVQSSYQFINTLDFDEAQVEALLKPSKAYITKIREDYDFMRYHFTHAYKRERDLLDEGEYGEEVADGLAERSDIIFTLMQINYAFKDTKLYANFRNKVVQAQKKRLQQGHILLPGTNATLFGNGPEMLLALSGEFDLHNPYSKPAVLGLGEIACEQFKDGERLVCARSPHITMGNVYCATNRLAPIFREYFDLGKNIVCVNAIGENMQQRLNGCDYDSDTMLITSDALCVERAFARKDFFKVPVCHIRSDGNKGQTLAELDHKTSENQVGAIVNLSQKLNSLLWDKLHSGCAVEEVQSIYQDICKLAVLSGIEIDKAKRAYDEVSASREIANIQKKYKAKAPVFFKGIDFGGAHREREYVFYKAPMEYVYRYKLDYREGKEQESTYIPVSALLKEPAKRNVSTVYEHYRKIVDICIKYGEKLPTQSSTAPIEKDKDTEYGARLRALYKELNDQKERKDNDEKNLLYKEIRKIKKRRNARVNAYLDEEYVLYLVLKAFEREGKTDWHLYTPLLESTLFQNMLNDSKEKMNRVEEAQDGEYDLYGLRFTKKS